jgi:hypothetical protein
MKSSIEANTKSKYILPEQAQLLVEKYNANESDDYRVLRFQRGSDINDINDVLEKYLTCTDKMIGMMDGSIKERELFSSPEIKSEEAPDVVVWLDKSARPVSWLTRELWDDLAKDGAKRPKYVYRNIDRVDWFMRQGHSADDSERVLGPGDFDIEKVSIDEIAQLRALSSVGELDKENWKTEVWEKPNSLDNKNILIIDEVKNKGGSLFIAQKLFQKAYPNAKVSGAYFWNRLETTLLDNPNETQIDSVPVWYSPTNEFGRGVGDRSPRYYESLPDTPANFKLKLGQIALSAPHYDVEPSNRLKDELAESLQADFRRLADSYREGIVLRFPDMHRSDEDVDKILKDQGLDINKLKVYQNVRRLIRKR